MININQKKAWLAIWISENVDFRAKNITRDKENHFMMTKRSVYQDDSLTTLNVCTQQMRPRLIKTTGENVSYYFIKWKLFICL